MKQHPGRLPQQSSGCGSIPHSSAPAPAAELNFRRNLKICVIDCRTVCQLRLKAEGLSYRSSSKRVKLMENVSFMITLYHCEDKQLPLYTALTKTHQNQYSEKEIATIRKEDLAYSRVELRTPSSKLNAETQNLREMQLQSPYLCPRWSSSGMAYESICWWQPQGPAGGTQNCAEIMGTISLDHPHDGAKAILGFKADPSDRRDGQVRLLRLQIQSGVAVRENVLFRVSTSVIKYYNQWQFGEELSGHTLRKLKVET